MNVEAHMSARVEKWTSTGSVHSRHSKVSCLFFGQLELWNSLSPALSHSSEYRREGASTHTVHCYTCAGAETEPAPLQEPFL